MNKTVDRFEQQARELVDRMTLEERASQLRYDAPAIPRLGIPAYNWWNEAPHGVARAGTATVFPQTIGLAASFDTALLYRVADVAATEGRAKYNMQSAQGDRDIYKGLTFWSPNVNIFRDPRWGRGQETYGEDPYLTAEMGTAFVHGLQQKDERGYMKAAGCAKHFAVHSGPEALRHEFDAVISPKDLRETYLPAFKRLVDEGVEGVMGAYNRTLGQPCCGSPYLLTEILRREWEFDGYTTSDCWAIRDFHEHHMVTSNMLESAQLALNSGCDLNCGCSYPYLMSAYEHGMITEEQITEAAVHVMRTRLRLGLMDEKCSFNAIGYDVVCCEDHVRSSIEAARESIVLLKNDGILPLNAADLKTVAVIGPNADNRTALLGNYHGTPDRYVTPLDAVCAEGERAGFRVLYSQGCTLTADRVEHLAMPDDRLSEAAAIARMSDVVLLFLGLDETIEGEEAALVGDIPCGDKPDLKLPECQQHLLETVCRNSKNVILMMMTGSAMNMCEADEKCRGILQLWYPGMRGGIACADVLFGRYSPAGKLPVTFYRHIEDLPDFSDYSMDNRTYRYFKGEPLYPFGYGLSYADIRMNALRFIDAKQIEVEISNASPFAASQVVQVYVKDLLSPYAPLNASLCGFGRITLEAGQSLKTTISLSDDSFTCVDENGLRIPGSGSYRLFAGFNQPDARSFELVGQPCLSIDISI